MPGRLLVRLAPLHKTILICLLLVPFCAARSNDHDWNYEETRSDARDFVAGGMLHVHMSVGHLYIPRGDSTKLQLLYTTKSHRRQAIQDAALDFDVCRHESR